MVEPRVGAAGSLEDGWACGIAGDDANVDPILQITKHSVVRVDDGDLVGFFARQVKGGGAADLACPKNDDFHVTTRFIRVTTSLTGPVDLRSPETPPFRSARGSRRPASVPCGQVARN